MQNIMDKSPLNFALVRNLSFLDRREMGSTVKEKKSGEVFCDSLMKPIECQTMMLVRYFSSRPTVIRPTFDETVVPRCSEYTNFCVSTSRLDELLFDTMANNCLLYTSPSPRDRTRSRMPSSA